MEFLEGRLLVFAKAPVPGRVKTRLAGKLGQRGAARLYKTLVSKTLNAAREANLCSIQLWCAPNARHGFFAACRRDYGVELQVQQGSDLGQRMDWALRHALAGCPYAVLIGGDCLSLRIDDLRSAFAALSAGQDAVLGPAEDGGYVLIGLRRPQPALFKGIQWGGAGVLAATRRRLKRTGLSWTELPPRWDIDRPADLRRLRRDPVLCNAII